MAFCSTLTLCTVMSTPPVYPTIRAWFLLKRFLGGRLFDIHLINWIMSFYSTISWRNDAEVAALSDGGWVVY